MTKIAYLLLFVCSFVCASENSLFDDLNIIKQIDYEIRDTLPVLYDHTMMVGYLNMPSARMAKSGNLAVGGGSIPPYVLGGMNFQIFSRLEVAATYRKYGDAENAREVNIKINILVPEDGIDWLPALSIGADDCLGERKFHSQYIVATKDWTRANLELSLGWGHGRLKGLFGGLAWTPMRKIGNGFWNNFTLAVEYDAFDYKHHIHEHPDARTVKSRLNGALYYNIGESLQLSVGSVRGDKIFGKIILSTPLGSTSGFLAKTKDKPVYSSPVNMEPLGLERPEKDFAQELAYALNRQGLDLFSAYLIIDENRSLWVKIVNNRYRHEDEVKRRIYEILAALVPQNIDNIVVTLESNALVCQSYTFTANELRRYRSGQIGRNELEILSPMQEALMEPADAELIFKRRKAIWSFSLLPRVNGFFAGSKESFKYDVGLAASPDGYLFDTFYYKMQAGYMLLSSKPVGENLENPSYLFNVRSDAPSYFQEGKFFLEQAYIQKSINWGRGWFVRLAGGYFEIAYGGAALEFLYYPVNHNFACGLEGALVYKRQYEGIGFTEKVLKYNGTFYDEAHFIGRQFFANLYYDWRSMQVDCRLTLGQFLARDWGGRLDVGRYFKNGVRFSLWYTLTNAHDKVDGRNYYDKGFAIRIPLDLFTRQSSRNYTEFAISALQRDMGARAETGRKLFSVINEERKP